MTDPSTSSSMPTPPTFIATVLDADAAPLIVKGRDGVIVYVRVSAGTLPPVMRNVLVHAHGWPWVSTLYGRPEKGAFTPTAALLTVPSGRTYPVTVLACLPALGTIRPSLRAGLDPPLHLEPAAVSIVLEGLPQHFRATAGRLSATGEPGGSATMDWEALFAQRHQIAMEAYRDANALPGRRLGEHAIGSATDEEQLLSALGDEREEVRDAAAMRLRHFAAQLPLAPFLAVIQDTRDLNAAACLAAAYVFAAHPDEASIDALLDLYHHMGAGVQRVLVHMVVVQALGRLGARASVEVIELLSGMLQERRARYDIRILALAASALGDVGERAPVEPLLAGMEHQQPEVACAAAQALAQHPAALPDEVRARAQIMSNLQTVRRMRYHASSRHLEANVCRFARQATPAGQPGARGGD